MRLVNKKDDQKTEKLKAIATLTEWNIIASTGNKSLIKDSIYRDAYDAIDGKRSHVEDGLSISYKNKCAYCERICKADIEHYRPKKAVDGVPKHKGYYWLCYEWTNLIPSCITCNREGAKHNQFPVLGLRVAVPPLLPDGKLDFSNCKADSVSLVAEIACLLHPEVDDPEDYFKFELDAHGEGIRIVGVDAAGRGNSTIDICKLNRLELKLDRVASVIDGFVDAIENIFTLYARNTLKEEEFKNNILHQINALRFQSARVEKTHTLLRKYIVKSQSNFEKIVLPFIDERCRSIVRAAF